MWGKLNFQTLEGKIISEMWLYFWIFIQQKSLPKRYKSITHGVNSILCLCPDFTVPVVLTSEHRMAAGGKGSPQYWQKKQHPPEKDRKLDISLQSAVRHHLVCVADEVRLLVLFSPFESQTVGKGPDNYRWYHIYSTYFLCFVKWLLQREKL